MRLAHTLPSLVQRVQRAFPGAMARQARQAARGAGGDADAGAERRGDSVGAPAATASGFISTRPGRVARPRGPLDATTLPEGLAGVDLRRIATELDGVFRRHGARTQAAPPDLLIQARRGALSSIATFVLEGDRVARAVVTHVRVAPLFAGLAITVHPAAEIDAPMLLADFMVLPIGVARAYLDTAGPAITRPDFETRFRAPLAAIVDGAASVARGPVPAWIAPLSGGNGARLRARRGEGETLARVLVRYVDRYMQALATAERSADPSANVAAAAQVRDAVRANGPARRHLARSFGDAFTQRYMRLLWREG